MGQDNYLLKLWDKANRLPAGKKWFSMIFARKAPYFGTIKPLVREVRPNYCEIAFKKRKGVENHIGTVHVIAICNALEMAMGAVAEATIPKHLRWIPRGMELQYTAKATSDIVAIAETSPEDWKPGDLAVRVRAERDDGIVVVEGVIMLYVSEKPPKK